MTEETETPRPADVAGRLDGLVSARIAWRWKDSGPSSFIEGYVREVQGNLLRIADWPGGNGDWKEVDEIDYRILGR